MEIKEVIEIITNAVQTEEMTAEQDKALAVIKKLCQKLDEGYTLCKLNDCIDKIQSLRDKQMDDFIKYKTKKKESLDRFLLIDECIDILKEDCL